MAVVGTMNDELTDVYSQTRKLKSKNEIAKHLPEIFIHWIKKYYQRKIKNEKTKTKKKCLPERIILYREGLNKTQISSVTSKEL